MDRDGDLLLGAIGSGGGEAIAEAVVDIQRACNRGVVVVVEGGDMEALP